MEGKSEKKISVRPEPPKRSVLEEVGNAVTHGTGALIGIAGLVLMLAASDTALKKWSAAIYGSCFITMFMMSCLYHAFKWGTKVKRLWRRFDYISIYLLIGGSFTPLWLLFWGNIQGLIFCIAEWAVILAGIVFISVFGTDRARGIHIALYIILGWCGLVFLPKMFRENIPLFCFILSGGLLYTLGIIPFAARRKGAHFIWHFFVLFGAVIHWFGIYFYLFRRM
ncbi:MAG: hemolysin III family protein [Clostridia bacterium]|nr:hemolysin III family protein [Clostridia bacterium]